MFGGRAIIFWVRIWGGTLISGKHFGEGHNFSSLINFISYWSSAKLNLKHSIAALMLLLETLDIHTFIFQVLQVVLLYKCYKITLFSLHYNSNINIAINFENIIHTHVNCYYWNMPFLVIAVFKTFIYKEPTKLTKTWTSMYHLKSQFVQLMLSTYFRGQSK